MQKFFTPKIHTLGKEPGTIIHVGEMKNPHTRITLIDFNDKHCEEHDITDLNQILTFKDRSTVTWINVDGLADTAKLEELGARLHLHPLTLEDIANTGQRPKMEAYPDYLFVVIKSFFFEPHDRLPTAEQISLILGKHYVITFQEQTSSLLAPIRDRIKQDSGRYRRSGPDYLFYSLIDMIVDNYFLVLESIGEKVELLEKELILSPGKTTLNKIYQSKREIMYLRKSVWPLRELCANLEREDSALISHNTRVFLRDVYDHSFQVIDTIETFRDILSNLLDIYLSSVSNKMNETMKVLTIISTFFIPLTFIVGLYGMNFVNMPELRWEYGYAYVLGLMTVIAVGMIVYFKRKKWW